MADAADMAQERADAEIAALLRERERQRAARYALAGVPMPPRDEERKDG